MSDQFVGEIRMFAGNYAPTGWHLCDGSLLPIQNYEALFVLLGKSYGGDGTTNFGIPDLRGRLPIGQGTGQGLTARPLAQKDGVSTVVLSSAQIPSHTHVLMASTAPATGGSASNTVLAQSGNSSGGTNQDAHYLAPNAPVSGLFVMAGNAIGSTGGSQPHENRMLSGCVNFIIALEGSFPSQD